jgi:hypothetical protein
VSERTVTVEEVLLDSARKRADQELEAAQTRHREETDRLRHLQRQFSAADFLRDNGWTVTAPEGS